MYQCNGILLIDKNDGETSFDVVRKIKKVLPGIKIGHAGTLDPFATGLLVILLGQGTKLSSFLMVGEKRYRATVRLGVATDTLDPTGIIINTETVPDFSLEQIKACAEKFVGEIEQSPPAFSALRFNGRRSYALARKGINVELPKRKIRISSIEIISLKLPYFTFEVTCSCGTYIRSLAADMGKSLGSCAHLKGLERLASGGFKVKDGLNSGNIDVLKNDQCLQERVISLSDALHEMREVMLDKQTAKKIKNGLRSSLVELKDFQDLPEDWSGNIKLVCENNLVAVIWIKCKQAEKIKVFQ